MIDRYWTWAAGALVLGLTGLLAWGLSARGAGAADVATVVGALLGTQGAIAFAWLRSPERASERDGAIEGLAERFDLDYDRQWRGPARDAGEIFSLFGSHPRERGRNVLAWSEARVPGATDGYYLDYEWPGARGVERRSVVAFRFEGARRRALALRPPHATDRLHPRFAAAPRPAARADAGDVRVYAPDPDAAREIVTARTRAALRRRGLPFCVEAAGEWMVLWDRAVAPEEIEAFVAKAQEVARALAPDAAAEAAA